MKTLLKISVVLFALVTTTAKSQSKVSLSLHQDARLLFQGDDKGNDAGTIDIVARFKMQGNQHDFGYIIVYPEFEYAKIEGTYKRYSANVGYTFNQLFITNLELSAAAGYGWIDRYGKTMFSWGGSGEIAYKVHHVKFSLMAQLTERSDLKYLYGKSEARLSGFFGIEFNLF